MLYTAIALFSLVAILGMILISFVLQDKATPKGLAFTHGGLAAAGIILLIAYSSGHTPAPFASLVLMIIAALGGFTLIYRDLTGNPVPKLLAIGHGLTAVAGFTFLLIFTFLR